MYFFRVEISSFDDVSKTFFIIPEQNADNQGIPFEEKMVTLSAEYKAFIKETKTSLVDGTYTQFQTAAQIANGISEELFEQLKAEGKLQELDSNTFSIVTSAKSSKKSSSSKNNRMMYFIIGGSVLFCLIMIIVSALSSGKSKEASNSSEISEIVESSDSIDSSDSSSSEPTKEIIEDSSSSEDESNSGYVDKPDNETSNDDYTNESGYSGSSSNGSSGVYSIKFNPNGGEGELESISSEAGQYVVLPSAETAAKSLRKKGYKLIGFSDNTEISYPLYNYKMPYRNVTMFAVWEPTTFTVTYNSNGGTGQLSRAEVKFGDDVPLPTDISVYKDGLYLSGWAKTDSAKSALKALKMPAENLTLYAVWSDKKPTAKLTLHYDGKVQVIEKEIGSTVNMLDDFGVSKDGQIVSGWYFKDSSNRLESLYISENCDVYAQWESARYITITIDQSYLNKKPIVYEVPLDMAGYAKLTLPVVNDKNDIYNSVPGCTYGFSTKKQSGAFGTIEYFGGVENKFSKDTTLYRVLNEYGGGKGTKDNPFIISSSDQLLRLSEQKAKGYFIQTADIKFPKNTERKPIDTETISRGYENKAYNFFVYDGQGYSIKNLSGNGGLFGTLSASTIQNVVIDGATISSGHFDNVGILCNEVISYSFTSSNNSEKFATGNSKIINCKVTNSKIDSDNAEYVGGLVGFGGKISECYANNISIRGGNIVGGIVGNACSVSGCLANNITVIGSVSSAGGITGTAYGMQLFDYGDNGHLSGGDIIGCGVRTFTSTAENSGGIVGMATSDTGSAFIKSCYVANVFLNGKNNGGIIGADGNKSGHKVVYCLVDNANKYSAIGSKKSSSTNTMVLSVPADTGLTVDGVLSVLNAGGSGYSSWLRNKDKNNGYPYPAEIKI